MSHYRTKTLIQTVQLGTILGDNACIRCHKPIAKGRIQRMVHLVDGGLTVLHPQDESLYASDEGDMLWFPIGIDCAKKLGLEWSIQLEKERKE